MQQPYEKIPVTILLWGITLVVAYAIGILGAVSSGTGSVNVGDFAFAVVLWATVAGGFRLGWWFAVAFVAFNAAGSLAGLVVPTYRDVVAATPGGWWLLPVGGLFELLQAGLLLAPATRSYARRRLIAPNRDQGPSHPIDVGARHRLGGP